jgi:hypothetical protein
LLFAFSFLITGCKQFDNQIVAKAFHHNLYLSEVIEKIPYAESKEDSLLFMEQYVQEWILRQTLIASAKKRLTQKEQDFSSQIKQYKEQLLINAYMKKISRDSSLFAVPLKNIDFYSETNPDGPPEYREMIKLNYIKLSNLSKHYKKIKDLFFDEKNRLKAIKQLELICADTIEYYLDNEHWFYTDVIEKDLPFSFSDKEKIDLKEKLDFEQEGNRYLVLILDRKQQLQPKNILEDKKTLQLLLQQQKKVEFINSYKDSLVQKALIEKKVIVFPVF